MMCHWAIWLFCHSCSSPVVTTCCAIPRAVQVAVTLMLSRGGVSLALIVAGDQLYLGRDAATKAALPG